MNEYFQRLFPCLLVCFFLVQCSNHAEPGQPEYIQVLDEISRHIYEVDNLTVFPGDSEPAYSIDLIPVQSYGDSEVPYFRRIAGCAVDENNRVIIWGSSDNFATDLHAYNADGTHFKKIGRSGRGPGEFERIARLQIKAGKIYAHDITNNRLSVFNTKDYTFDRTTVLQDWNVRNLDQAGNMRLLTFNARNDGRLLAVFDEYPPPMGRRENIKYFLVDNDGNALGPDPLMALSGGFSISSKNQRGFTLALPFMGLTLFALSDDDAMFTARTDDFLIKKYDAKGKYQSAFYYPIKGPPFDLDSMDGFFGHSQRDIKNALEEHNVEIPDSYPILRAFNVDDESRIWVALTVEYMKSYEWWVLAESGELLAKFSRPFNNHQICDIQNGFMYSHNFDRENGEDQIVKYRIELTKQ